MLNEDILMLGNIRSTRDVAEGNVVGNAIVAKVWKNKLGQVFPISKNTDFF